MLKCQRNYSSLNCVKTIFFNITFHTTFLQLYMASHTKISNINMFKNCQYLLNETYFNSLSSSGIICQSYNKKQESNCWYHAALKCSEWAGIMVRTSIEFTISLQMFVIWHRKHVVELHSINWNMSILSIFQSLITNF